jgi:hypothetical protein
MAMVLHIFPTCSVSIALRVRLTSKVAATTHLVLKMTAINIAYVTGL